MDPQSVKGYESGNDDGTSVLAGSYFVLSMMDRLWRPDLSEEEAVRLMEKGIEEVSIAHI